MVVKNCESTYGNTLVICGYKYIVDGVFEDDARGVIVVLKHSMSDPVFRTVVVPLMDWNRPFLKEFIQKIKSGMVHQGVSCRNPFSDMEHILLVAKLLSFTVIEQ